MSWIPIGCCFNLMPCTLKTKVFSSKEKGTGFLLTVKANQWTLSRQIQRQFESKRQIAFRAMDHEISPGHAPLSDQSSYHLRSIAAIGEIQLEH